MASSVDTSTTYQEVSRDEALRITDGVQKHAAHVMLYAKVDKKLFGRYDIKYTILVSWPRYLILSYIMYTYIHVYNTW